MTLIEQIRAAINHTAEIAEMTRSGGYEPDIWEIQPSRSGRWSEIVAKCRTIGEPREAAAREDDQPVALAQAGRCEDQHIAHNDPAAVLRRCAADRKILDIHEREGNRYGSGTACSNCDADRHEISFSDRQGCDTVLALAEAYGVTDGGEA